jgi:hypothetical protein
MPNSLALGDLNGDGALDLAVASIGNTAEDVTGSVSVLFGNGDGSLQTPVDLEPGGHPAFLRLGDQEGDGDLDIAVSVVNNQWPSSGLVYILFNDGNGNFSIPVQSSWAAASTVGMQADPASDLLNLLILLLVPMGAILLWKQSTQNK